MPEQNRRACLSTYVLNAVVLGAIDRVKGNGKVGQPDDEEKASIERDLDLFIEFCNNRKIRPRELEGERLDREGDRRAVLSAVLPARTDADENRYLKKEIFREGYIPGDAI